MEITIPIPCPKMVEPGWLGCQMLKMLWTWKNHQPTCFSDGWPSFPGTFDADNPKKWLCLGTSLLEAEIYNPLSKVGPFSTDEVYSSRPPKHTSIHIHMNILIYLCFYILYVLYIRQHCPNSLACLPLADVSLAEHLISTLGRGAAWINCSNVILCSDPFLTARWFLGNMLGSLFPGSKNKINIFRYWPTSTVIMSISMLGSEHCQPRPLHVLTCRKLLKQQWKNLGH